MRFYNHQDQYYCGVDLHARSMYTHIVDVSTRRARRSSTATYRPRPALFLDAVAPFRLKQWAVDSGQ